MDLLEEKILSIALVKEIQFSLNEVIMLPKFKLYTPELPYISWKRKSKSPYLFIICTSIKVHTFFLRFGRAHVGK